MYKNYYLREVYTIECSWGFAEVAVEKIKEGTAPYTAIETNCVHISI